MTSESKPDLNITKAAEIIEKAEAIAICAGAGMGVDSGLPDFRGNEGFWKAYPPFGDMGLSFIDLANPEWFDQDPALAWGFYGHRLNLYRETTPHKGFEILLNWTRMKSDNYFVFTSNVDGQFLEAGFKGDRIVECHGSIHHMQCTDPHCRSFIWPAEDFSVSVDNGKMRARKPLPHCPACSAVARPNILMFGDWNWLGNRSERQRYRFNQWLLHHKSSRIAVIECGAGTGVPTVRMTSESLIAAYNATLIRINTREPQVPEGQVGIDMGAQNALEQINALLEDTDRFF